MAFDYWQQLEERGVYHLYNRSVNKERLFKDSRDYAFFLKKIQKYLLPYLEVYAYCLIPNHFHFLIEVRVFDEQFRAQLSKEKTKTAKGFMGNEISVNSFLEDQFRRLFSSYALYFNHRYKRHGALFQKRLKRIAVKNDVKQLLLICYIHHNPIHHGIVRNYEDWKYSSYNAFLSEKPTNISKNRVLNWFGSGDGKIGKTHFWQHHQDFKLPSSEIRIPDW